MPIMVQAHPRPKSGDTEPKAAAKKPRRPIGTIERHLKRLGDYPKVDGPYAAEDYDALTRRRLDWMAQRSRLLAELTEARKSDTEAVKAANAPTVEVAVDDPEAKKRARRNLTRVRQSEAWRHKQLTPMQRQAEIEMALAWKVQTQGTTAVSPKYGAVGGGRDGFAISAAMDATWRDWMAKAKGRAVNVGAFIDCLVEPKTLAGIERERKFKRGSVLPMYKTGLNLWCELRGWARSLDSPCDS